MDGWMDGRTNAYFPLRGHLITQHDAIGDSRRICNAFGDLLPWPSAKDGHRHVDIKKSIDSKTKSFLFHL